MWTAAWRTVRAIATPWVERELAAARDKLRRARRADVVIDRDVIDRAVAAAAPPGVPFEAVVLPASALATRFPDGPAERRGYHFTGRVRMTHRALPTDAVLAIALYSDVAADYFIE